MKCASIRYALFALAPAALAVLTASCVDPLGNKRRLGLADGERAAREDLANNEAHIYVAWHRPLWQDYDPLTGLTRKNIRDIKIAPYIDGLREGYNRTVLDHIQQHGHPPNSRIRWGDIIMSPSTYWRKRPPEAIHALTPKAAPVRWHDGRYKIELIERPLPNVGLDLPPGYAVKLHRPEKTPLIRGLIGIGDIDPDFPVELAWGPKEADIALILTRRTAIKDGERQTILGVLDLRDGSWLNSVILTK